MESGASEELKMSYESSELAQQVKMLATELSDRSPIPGTHSMEEENQF